MAENLKSFHHSDNNLPPVEVVADPKQIFEGQGRPERMDDKVTPMSGEHMVMHHGSPVGTTVVITDPRETFDRGASPYQGMDHHPDTGKLPDIKEAPPHFDVPQPPPEEGPVDPKLVFGTSGMD